MECVPIRAVASDAGDFLDQSQGLAAPPFVRLRELEGASLALERNLDNTAAAVDDWNLMRRPPSKSHRRY